MADMHVELVAVERRLWSGEANFVLARTTVGEIGILPGHEPTLAQMVEAGVVRIDATDGSQLTVAVHGGFLSITAGGGDDPRGVRRVRRTRSTSGGRGAR